MIFSSELLFTASGVVDTLLPIRRLTPNSHGSLIVFYWVFHAAYRPMFPLDSIAVVVELSLDPGRKISSFVSNLNQNFVVKVRPNITCIHTFGFNEFCFCRLTNSAFELCCVGWSII